MITPVEDIFALGFGTESFAQCAQLADGRDEVQMRAYRIISRRQPTRNSPQTLGPGRGLPPQEDSALRNAARDDLGDRGIIWLSGGTCIVTSERRSLVHEVGY